MTILHLLPLQLPQLENWSTLSNLLQSKLRGTRSKQNWRQKLIEYLDCEQQAVQVQEQPATQARSNDLVDLHLATIAAMIHQRLNSEQQNDLLPKLFNFVNQSITQYEAGRQGFAGVGAHDGNVAGPNDTRTEQSNDSAKETTTEQPLYVQFH